MVRTPVQTNHMCDCPNRLHIDVVGTADRRLLHRRRPPALSVYAFFHTRNTTIPYCQHLAPIPQPLRHANHLPRGRNLPGGVRCAPRARWHRPCHVARCRCPANSDPRSPRNCVAGRPQRSRRTEGGGCTISEGAQRRMRCEGATPHHQQRCCPPCAVSPCRHDVARHDVACTNRWHAFRPSMDNTQQQPICPIGN